MTTRNDRIEHYCELMHDAYEMAAIGAGWETQQASRELWPDVPEANKATMRVAVAALLDAVDAEMGRQVEALRTHRAITEGLPRD